MWKDRLIKLNYLSLCFLACFPVIHMKVTVYAIILFTALAILSGIVAKTYSFRGVRAKEFVILFLPFLLILVRTWLGDKSEASLFYLEVSLSLAAFPVAWFFSSAHSGMRKKQLINWIFILSSVVIVLYGELVVWSKLLQHLGPGKFWKSTAQMLSDPSLPFHIRTVFEEAVSLHPTYAALFIGMSLLLITDTLLGNFKNFSAKTKTGLITLILLMLFMQLILASRTPFLGTMAGTLLLVFLHFRKKILAVYAALGIVLAGILMVWLVPTFSARFREISISNTSLPTEQHENSFNLRTGIYKCSMDIIRENWLTGIGPGNVQDRLNSCYSAISPEVYEEKNYNTHNQFLDYWAGLGIAGLLSLLLIFGYSFIANLQRGNKAAVALTLLLFIACLTENILTRQNGVVTFAFFIGLNFFTQASRYPGEEAPFRG